MLLRDLLIRDKAVILATLSPTSFPYYVGYTLYWNAFPNADTIALANTIEYKEIILGVPPPPPPGTGTGLVELAIGLLSLYWISRRH